MNRETNNARQVVIALLTAVHAETELLLELDNTNMDEVFLQALELAHTLMHAIADHGGPSVEETLTTLGVGLAASELET